MKNVFLPTIEDVKGDTEWSALELDLLDECRLGREAYLPGREDRPTDTNDPDRRVRAELIRYLLLGGGKGKDAYRPHPKGIMLRGAWIDGVLDLAGCHTRMDLSLHHCLFPHPIILQDAEIGALYLDGSHAKAQVNLQRLTVESGVHLRKGFEADQGVDLAGAQIGGQLACDDGKFRNPGKLAINANGAQIGDAVFFLGKEFLAEGEVKLIGASITGQLTCQGGTFRNPGGRAIDAQAARVGSDVFWYGATVEGEIDFSRSAIVGDFQLESLHLNGKVTCRGAKVSGALDWQGVSGKVPMFDSRDATVSVLHDDQKSWDRVEQVHLSGFRYDRLDSDLTIVDRLGWLRKSASRRIVSHAETLAGRNGFDDVGYSPLGWLNRAHQPDVSPQPYTQLAQVLAAAGDRSGASRILCAREKAVRRAGWHRAHARIDGSFDAGVKSSMANLKRVSDWVFGWLFGYGYQPARALLVILILVIFASVLYGSAYQAGQMAPNSDVILTSQAWQVALAVGCGVSANGGCVMPLDHWLTHAKEAVDYETFNPVLYAIDLFVPLDALGQETTWAPAKDRGFWGWLGYYARMPIQMSGWIITAIGAAVVTGLVGRKD